MEEHLKTLLICVLALILISCKKEIEPKPGVKTVDSVKVVKNFPLTTIGQVDSTDLFIFREVKQINSEKDSTQSIQILSKSNGKQIQVIQSKILSYTVEDINFDGQLDLTVVTGFYTHGDISDFWIYDSLKMLFIKDTVISGLPGVHVDKMNKLLTTYTECEFGGIEDTYRYLNGKPILTSENSWSLKTDSTGKQESYILLEHSKLINTELKTIESKKVSADSGFISFDPTDYPQKKRTN